ncbi:MAG: histidine ammonia-lyase [Pseudomonadota bacterium]
MQKIIITPGSLSLKELKQIWQSFIPIELNPQYKDVINQSSETVQSIIDQDLTVYGINTGFGLLANTRIEKSELRDLQKRLVLSHSTGTGQHLENNVVRLIMALKVNALAQGFSGVRLEVIEALINLYNQQCLPCIPEKGSVGASGDLAPLAHLSATLLGEGQVQYDKKQMSSSEALKRLNLSPLSLAPKEGLALLNGTQVSTALALHGLFLAEHNFSAGILSGAMSIDASMASDAPFDARIHLARGHQGQIDVAKATRQLLENSSIRASHTDCNKVQDPYSLRCQPQVMGACLDQMRFVAKTLLIEANAVSDNPLVFSDNHEIVSGGNFHAEPVALAADNLAIAISEIGAISERRIALLMDHGLSGLPAFLVSNGGINSGFMISQVTAAALASENKSLAHPASVDSLPTSANQEDHVSMATFAARRLHTMNENTATVIGIELLAAAQGIDFRKPQKTSPNLQIIYNHIREKVSFYQEDRYFASDIESAKQLVMQNHFNEVISTHLILPSVY